MMEEVWKDIKGFEGLYQFSNLYRVKSSPRATTSGKILKIQIGGHGYPHVSLCKNGKYKIRKIHHLVLEYFIGPCPYGMECRHKNDIKTDYRIQNLIWGTKIENAQDRISNGKQIRNLGSKNGMAKLIDENILEIRKLINAKIPIKIIAKRFNISERAIYSIDSGESWSHIK